MERRKKYLVDAMAVASFLKKKKTRIVEKYLAGKPYSIFQNKAHCPKKLFSVFFSHIFVSIYFSFTYLKLSVLNVFVVIIKQTLL